MGNICRFYLRGAKNSRVTTGAKLDNVARSHNTPILERFRPRIARPLCEMYKRMRNGDALTVAAIRRRSREMKI